MNKKDDLMPIEQQSVHFYGDKIQAVRMSDSTIYVAIKPICENLGLSWPSQFTRIKNDPILSTKTMSIVFNTTDINPSSRRPKTSEMLALPLSFIQGWLFRIDSRRVKETVRDDLIQYQEKCYTVLAEAFSPDNSRIGRLWQLYQKAGRSAEWIQYRLRGISVRHELTEEWASRGVEENVEYALLTDEISKGVFGLTTNEHKELKQLEKDALRDHMTNLELAFTILGEASTTEIARQEDAQGFTENKFAAQEGGKIAGDARKALEAKTGKSVVTPRNFLSKQSQPRLLDDET